MRGVLYSFCRFPRTLHFAICSYRAIWEFPPLSNWAEGSYISYQLQRRIFVHEEHVCN